MGKREETDGTPLSRWAEYRLDWEVDWEGFIMAWVLITGFLSAMAVLVDLGFTGTNDFNFYPLIIVLILSAGVGSFFSFRYRRKMKALKTAILAENETDYRRSLAIKEVFRRLTTLDSDHFPVVEEPIKGEWRPFRVEHFLSDSIRGSISGHLRGFMGGVWGGCMGGTINGSVAASATPNLLDASSMLFLKNDQGDTLRVLIPSPRVTREMLVSAVRGWAGEFPSDCHTGKTLIGFSMPDEHLIRPISNAPFVDQIDSSMELPQEERPVVGVIGQEIQSGVVIATALSSGDKRVTILPSGFFREFAAQIAQATACQIAAPETIAAVPAV